ncbi:MAG: hypothetical protein RL685_2899 [Pseudomonadota bacterium]|jgi:DNA-binding response OmpR family regulator
MPDLLGVDVCRFVRISKDAAELPILMLTCDGSENTVVDALSSGANDFLELPCSPRELIGRVSALVEVAALHAKLQHAQAELRLELHSFFPLGLVSALGLRIDSSSSVAI